MGSKYNICHYLPILFYIYIIEAGDLCKLILFSLLKYSCILDYYLLLAKNLNILGDFNLDLIVTRP